MTSSSQSVQIFERPGCYADVTLTGHPQEWELLSIPFC